MAPKHVFLQWWHTFVKPSQTFVMIRQESNDTDAQLLSVLEISGQDPH